MESENNKEAWETGKNFITVRFVTSHKQVSCQWLPLLPEGGSQSQETHVIVKGKEAVS